MQRKGGWTLAGPPSAKAHPGGRELAKRKQPQQKHQNSGHLNGTPTGGGEDLHFRGSQRSTQRVPQSSGGDRWRGSGGAGDQTPLVSQTPESHIAQRHLASLSIAHLQLLAVSLQYPQPPPHPSQRLSTPPTFVHPWPALDFCPFLVTWELLHLATSSHF